MEFSIEHLSKSFGEKKVLEDIHFSFEEGKFMAFWVETERAKQRSLTV